MVKGTHSTHLKIFRSMSLVLAFAFLLLWSTAAYAQSREGQYGSPTDTGNVAGQALSVLPDTGGPLALFVGGALIVAGTSVALVRRRAGHHW